MQYECDVVTGTEPGDEDRGEHCLHGVAVETAVHVWRRRDPGTHEKAPSGVSVGTRAFYGGRDDLRELELSVGIGLAGMASDTTREGYEIGTFLGPGSIMLYATNHRVAVAGQSARWSHGAMLSLTVPLFGLLQAAGRGLTKGH